MDTCIRRQSLIQLVPRKDHSSTLFIKPILCQPQTRFDIISKKLRLSLFDNNIYISLTLSLSQPPTPTELSYPFASSGWHKYYFSLPRTLDTWNPFPVSYLIRSCFPSTKGYFHWSRYNVSNFIRNNGWQWVPSLSVQSAAAGDYIIIIFMWFSSESPLYRQSPSASVCQRSRTNREALNNCVEHFRRVDFAD